MKIRETCHTTSVFISESELPKTKYPDNPELGELSFVFFFLSFLVLSVPAGFLSKCCYSIMSFFVLEMARKMWEQPEKSGIVFYYIYKANFM